MYWQEEQDVASRSSDWCDYVYSIECKTLPLDHAFALSTAIEHQLTWLQDEPNCGIHQIHGAESGNGWYRPENDASALLHLSRRTKLMIRVPEHRVADAANLSGQQLDVAGYPLKVGRGEVRALSKITTLYARYVIAKPGQDENEFLGECSSSLKQIGVKPRRMVCGKETRFTTPDGELLTRSLMVADLTLDEAIILQEQGLGEGRRLGCGLFIPHKSIQHVTRSE